MNEAKEEKKDIIGKYRAHKNDTGSTKVQIALLGQRITELASHLKKHAKDYDSKRGLLIMLGKRRRLLNYTQKMNPKEYSKLIVELKLKK